MYLPALAGGYPMYRMLIVLMLISLLAGCQQSYTRPESSYYSTLPIGSEVIVHEPLLISPQNVVVKIQAGELAPPVGPFAFDPWCQFSLTVSNSSAYTIEPGKFRITRVSVYTSVVLANHAEAVMLASSETPAQAWFADASAPWVQHFTDMYLESDSQPEVYLLSCQYTANQPATQYPLSVDEIRQTLDPVVTFKRPGPQTGTR